ncbi:hypothetical protein ACFWAR_12010 [Streptomyces sp. NPDC059917]|uniref:hypothetical protein n=1 Tax=Streptomyces sp. NPDC059917 TaxID=3347002 RepID=UPI00365F076F
MLPTSISPGAQRPWYERPPDAPLVRGDRVDDRPVIGMACTPDEPRHRLLVKGEECLSAPPHRAVPDGDEADGPVIERTGPAPADRIAADDMRSAEELAPGLSEAVDLALSVMGVEGRFIRALLDDVDSARHHAWLVGGTVRDLVGDGAGATPNDLDFAGTMAPHAMRDAMDRGLRAEGLGDYYLMENEISMVCSVAPVLGEPRIVEYKPLEVKGFAFPVHGGDLVDDVTCRDLTINSLYYDHRRKIVLDPSGWGLPDLLAAPRRLRTPYDGDDPLRRVAVVIRFLKFAFRMPDADRTPFAAWARALPPDLADRVPEEKWRALTGFWRHCLPGDLSARAVELATADLGPGAGRVALVLHERSR